MILCRERDLVSSGAALVLMLWTVALTAGDSPVLGQELREIVERGKAVYAIYCANCHGPKGQGNGPLAEVLTVPPSDLTRIANNSAGEFPAERLYQIIDGRFEILPHGRREMPLWGDLFEGQDGDEPSARVRELVEFLKSIQVGRRSGYTPKGTLGDPTGSSRSGQLQIRCPAR